MRVLLIGGGGREHALGWKIAQSPLCDQLYFAPGNPGTAALGENITLGDNTATAAWAKDNQIDLVVVGPEQPLVDGLADTLAQAGVPCFGPSAAAARLEGSKAFAKEIMDTVNAPTAGYARFSEFDAAMAYVREQGVPQVVKADGLAAGKGVTICHSLNEAETALREALLDGRFGDAGAEVVIEEFLEGVECSFHLISDGKGFVPLITAKDHKAIFDGDKGPNTGGMGTYAPNPLLDDAQVTKIQKDICEPVLRHMGDQGMTFRGVLFTGLMLTEKGPKVLEFNVRFGDPETQVMLPMLDFDLLPVLHGAAVGQLPDGPFPYKQGAAVCVVLASAGYPAGSSKGDVISGVADTENGVVFHAGTKMVDDQLVTAGGRVLGATAWDADLSAARKRAYAAADAISFDGKQNRSDIGGFDD